MYPLQPQKWQIEHREYHRHDLQDTDKFFNFVKHKGVILSDHGPDNSRSICVQEAMKYVRQNQNAIDVGCRDGEYTRYLTRHFQHCFTFDYRYRLHFSFNVNTNMVTHFTCALGERPGSIKASGRGNIRAKKIDGGWKPGDGGVLVEIYNLDQFDLRDVGLLKVDVDGMDEEVLRGAHGLIRDCKPVIIVEQESDSTHNAIGYLTTEFGYEIKFKTRIDWVLA